MNFGGQQHLLLFIVRKRLWAAKCYMQDKTAESGQGPTLESEPRTLGNSHLFSFPLNDFVQLNQCLNSCGQLFS